MSIEITMPRLSDTMEQGTIIKWNVEEGADVSAGDAVADIETDKATMEMQVYDDGKVAKIIVPEGKTVEIGTVIAVLAEEGEDPEEVARSASDGAAKAEKDEEAESSEESKSKASKGERESKEREPEPAVASAGRTSGAGRESSPEPPAESNGEARLRVSPVAQRIAIEHGVDIRRLEGSGPSGRIIKRDVLEAIEQAEQDERREPAAAPDGRAAAAPSGPAPTVSAPARQLEPGKKPLSNMRQTIAKRLAESKQTIPHYQVTMVFNMGALLDLRAAVNEQLESQGIRLSVNDFLIRACALAIHQHPEFNATFGDDHIEVHEDVNVAMAVALPAEKGGGLIAATIRNADRKGLRQISEESRALAEKARTRGLTLEEMSDSTFTVSNLGMFGVEHFTAIINPPNSAILATGSAMEKPVVRDGGIIIGHEMQATLSLDHRVIDGAMAAQYLQTLKQLIENPATLMV